MKAAEKNGERSSAESLHDLDGYVENKSEYQNDAFALYVLIESQL